MAVFLFAFLQSVVATEVTVKCSAATDGIECNCVNNTKLEKMDTLKFDVENADSITSLFIGETIRMTNISNNIFTTFCHLLKLHIKHNLIVLQDDSFRDAYTLKELHLKDNNVTTIPDNVFDGMVSLEGIDLSSNNIYEVRRMAFAGAPNIKFVILESNRIKTIEINSFNLPNLEFLDLSENQLSDIEYAFRNCTRLKNLMLGRNLIETIQEGSLNLPNLELLDLSYNKLKALNTLLNGLPNLKFLTLSHNKISHIGNTFTGRSKLMFLNLEANPIVDINLTEFSNVESLQYLDISETGYKLPNEIPYISKSVSNLERLSLNSNSLSNPDIFKHLTFFSQLQFLSICYNDFTSFNNIDKIKDYLPKIKSVLFTPKRLICDCIKEKGDIIADFDLFNRFCDDFAMCQVFP